jgi:putative DNA primase/helicase
MKGDAYPTHTVLTALGIERTEAIQYRARCPAHDDGTASLSVNLDSDGTIGLHCHAGCAADAICAAAGVTMADLFPRKGKAKAKGKAAPKRKAKPRKQNKRAAAPLTDAHWHEAEAAAKKLGPPSLAGFKLAAVYPYRLANGTVHGWRARYESQSGEKQIKPFHHDGGEWVLKEATAPRAGKPLYRLPEVLATDGPVFIVEGEKCADALAALGVAATTSGAAKSASKADWKPLAGRTCVIWPDNDDPGDQYASDVATILQDLDCDVSLIDVPALDLPGTGDDAADWLASNPAATAADVLALPAVEPEAEAGVLLVRASDITAKAIDWTWPGYLAGGMLTLIAGNGGTGKTTIALSIAAAITTGGKWPDGAAAPQGSVIMWSGEDALAEVLVPRLQEAGADTSRVHFVSNGDGDVFDPAADMPRLERVARRLSDLALVIVDPIVSMVQGDSHKNAEVRRGLQPLLDLAADTGAAVIGITHYAKNTAGRNTTDRVIGSVAFSAVARVVLATAMGQDGEGRMVRAKNNVGATGDGFAYSIDVVNREIEGQVSQVSKIVWGQPLYGFADELLGQVEAKRTPKDEAAEWLAATLHDGPVSSKELKAKAEADGIAWRTVERAKEELGVSALRRTEPGQQRGKGEWVWRLPPNKHQ